MKLKLIWRINNNPEMKLKLIWRINKNPEMKQKLIWRINKNPEMKLKLIWRINKNPEMKLNSWYEELIRIMEWIYTLYMEINCVLIAISGMCLNIKYTMSVIVYY